MDASQVLLVTHVVCRYEVEVRIAAEWCLTAQMKPLRLQMHFREANHAQVLDELVFSSDFWMLLQIRIAVKDLVRLLEIFVYELGCVEPENCEQGAEGFPLLLCLWLFHSRINC